jgi:peptidoglycan/xylan/chitin deacetylase (PgdA/CDA1 family)
MGHLKLPEGKKIAVNLGVDFDGQSLWPGGFNRPSPSFMSRGEFCAEVGTPRLLALFRKHEVRTTFFTPGIHFRRSIRKFLKRATELRIMAITRRTRH